MGNVDPGKFRYRVRPRGEVKSGGAGFLVSSQIDATIGG